MKGKTTMKDQIWQLLLEYLWTPLVAAFAFLWSLTTKVQEEVKEVKIVVAEHETQIETILTAVDEARTSRREIYDKVDATRVEATTQAETIRKEQREDFKEIRELISSIGK